MAPYCGVWFPDVVWLHALTVLCRCRNSSFLKLVCNSICRDHFRRKSPCLLVLQPYRYGADWLIDVLDREAEGTPAAAASLVSKDDLDVERGVVATGIEGGG